MQTVLLLDSCTLTRECLTTILRAKGFRVQSSAQIAQAKLMIAKRAPDLIITEIRLPDDNILNLMRSFKDDPGASKIKVCLLTQAAAKKPIMEAIQLGACKVMLKSKFTVAGFIEQVSAICAAPAAESMSINTESAPEVSVKFPLPLPDQDPSLALKEIKPIIARAVLKERLEELEELSTIGQPITTILEAIDAPEPKINDIVALLKLDQTIAMKIMRVVNSQEYARGEQTTTLKEAVIRIGLEAIRELVSEIKVVDQNLCGHDQQHFWDHALSVAVCSSKIAELSEDIDPELAFTAAILHDIGRVILQQALPTEYEQVLETSIKLGVSLELVEKRILLSDHSAIAQNILHSWNLPKDLIDAIANHHCPANMLATVCPKNTKLAAIVELANRITHAIGIGSSGNRAISSTEELFDIIAIEGLTLTTITDGLEDQINTMRSRIYPSDGSIPLSKADTPIFDRAFHPLFISMDPDSDAIGHWVMSLADEAQSEDTLPNIAIIHARQPKSKQELADKLESALARFSFDSGSQPIPVLVLSPSGKTAIPDELLSKHPSKILMSPISTLRFEQSVNHLLNGMVRAEEPWPTKKAA